jgi:putative ABC transport system permease protein
MHARLRRFVMRFRYAFGSRRAERELAREVAAHLGLLEDEYRRRGMTAEDARFAARRAIGGVEPMKELQREARSFAWIASARRDLRFAFRTLTRSRGVTALVILTLGLGIGATTSVYSAFDAALLRPLPFPQPAQLVHVRGFFVPIDLRGMRDSTGSPAAPRKTSLDLGDLSGMRDVFSHVAAHATGAINLGTGAEPLRVDVTFVTVDFFATLKRGPQLGRLFAPSEMAVGAAAVVVLSDRLWRSQFGADPAIVGRTVRLDTVPHEVVGVMPPDFRFPAQAQLWKPLPVPVPMSVMSAFRNFLPSTIVARLAPGVTATVAARRLEAAQQQFQQSRKPASAAVPIGTVTPLQRSLVADRRTALLVLMASATLLLVIACANAATLLLSLATARRREIATHAVLGATRARILIRLLVESVMLAVAAALVGLVIAKGTLSILPVLLPAGLAGLAPVQLDLRVLAFATTVAVATGIAFGLVPAVGASRLRIKDALQDAAAREFTSSGRANRTLVVLQVAVACLLTIGAALMGASLRSLLGNDVGMRIDRVASARVNLPEATYPDVDARARFIQAAVTGLGGMPLVAGAAAINTLPLAREPGIGLRVDPEGAKSFDRESPHMAPYLVISPGYFSVMGIPLLRGRDLAWSDTSQLQVAVINRTLARQLWRNEDALGKRFLFGGPELRTVVGIVADARIAGLETEPGAQVYLPINEQPQNYVSLVAATADPDDVAALPQTIRAAVRRVDPDLPTFAAQPMEEILGEALASRRINTVLISVFGLVALGLAAIGVYGVLACSVNQRRREIGVRVALGAQRREVLALILRQGMVLVAIGLVLGMGAGLAATRYLEGMLYGVTPREPAVFLGVAAALLTVGLLAALVPARRAAGADPLTALRSE